MFVLLKVQSLQLSFRPAGVSLGGGGGPRPPSAPPGYAPANGVFTPEQDTDKTNVDPVHSYDAFHTRHVDRTWCERHHRNAQGQHLSCRCLALV